MAFTLFLVLVPQISFPKAAGDTGTTALRMVPIGPHDDIGSMWEAQIESVIYAGIDDTGNMPFINIHIDENGYLTALVPMWLPAHQLSGSSPVFSGRI